MRTYVDEWEGKNHKRGKQQVNSVAHSLEHLRGEPGDQEGEEPVGGGNERLRGGTDVGGENLGSVDPGLKQEWLVKVAQNHLIKGRLTVPFQVGL